MLYNGWKITKDSSAPVTGTFRADRFGVGLCAGSLEMLQRMIDAKNKELKSPPSWRKV